MCVRVCVCVCVCACVRVCLYINCFNRLRFFAEGSAILQKMYFFGNMETRQMAHFFIYFFRSNCL